MTNTKFCSLGSLCTRVCQSIIRCSEQKRLPMLLYRSRRLAYKTARVFKLSYEIHLSVEP